MKKVSTVVVLSILALTLTGESVFAQDHRDGPRDNHRYVRHNDWRKGSRMNHGDWSRGERVDYRRYHLNAPPRGYEWRELDGNYVMAAVATGLIASVIAASAAH